MKACFTIDVEPDCLPYMGTFRGIEEGMDPLLRLLRQEKVPATFFTTGQIARDYPECVQKIVAEGHELASHGHAHRDFMTMDENAAREDIRTSAEILREFAPVTSFRAPYLQFPDTYLHLLEDSGFLLDSSQAKYKLSYYKKSPASSGLTRIPVSLTSSALRLPHWIRTPYLTALASPLVLYVHPWEFVDLTRENLRYDCRFKTGETAVECVRSVLRQLKRKKFTFVRMNELHPQPSLAA